MLLQKWFQSQGKQNKTVSTGVWVSCFHPNYGETEESNEGGTKKEKKIITTIEVTQSRGKIT